MKQKVTNESKPVCPFCLLCRIHMNHTQKNHKNTFNRLYNKVTIGVYQNLFHKTHTRVVLYFICCNDPTK